MNQRISRRNFIGTTAPAAGPLFAGLVPGAARAANIRAATGASSGIVLGLARVLGHESRHRIHRRQVTRRGTAIMLMEELRIELAGTTIGTSAFIPGGVATNLRNSESYRPTQLRNEVASGPARPGGGPAPQTGPLPPGMMDPLEAGRSVLDGIRHNDLFIFSHPEFRPGVEMRFNSVLESMLTPPPPNFNPAAALRTPIYSQEIAHRRATRRRN